MRPASSSLEAFNVWAAPLASIDKRQLAHGKDFLLGDELSMGDFYLLPSTFAFSLTSERQSMYPKFPGFGRWGGAHGRFAGDAKGARVCATLADRTRTQRGHFARAEILTISAGAWRLLQKPFRPVASPGYGGPARKLRLRRRWSRHLWHDQHRAEVNATRPSGEAVRRPPAPLP